MKVKRMTAGKDKLKNQVREIEETQEMLRESIEEAKRLAEASAELLKQHKRDLSGKT